jgi:hypothetical protein
MPKGIRKLHISLGEPNLTHFGGIFLIHHFCQKLKFKQRLQNTVRQTRRQRGYNQAELTLAIIYALIVGIPRLSKTKILQGNGAFQKIIGLRSYPYASSLRRFIKSITKTTNDQLDSAHDAFRQKIFTLSKPSTSIIFDFDSTVITVYGKYIEGAEVGYNPHKRGARSYQPLLCFEAHTRDFWHGILRPGDRYTSYGSVDFFKNCLAKVPSHIYRIRARADSGFFDHKFIEALEEAHVGYAVVVKLTKPIKRTVCTIRYRLFKSNAAVAEFTYQPMGWKTPHRFIAIRKPLADKETNQLSLFSTGRYSYQVFVTNLPLQPEQVWYFYRPRAAIETDIRELKQSFSLAKIPTNSFQANQAFFSLLTFSYNILNWFKRLCLPPRFKNAAAETIRQEFLVLPARLVKSQNRNILNLPSEYISKATIDGIIKRIDSLRP